MLQQATILICVGKTINFFQDEAGPTCAAADELAARHVGLLDLHACAAVEASAIFSHTILRIYNSGVVLPVCYPQISWVSDRWQGVQPDK